MTPISVPPQHVTYTVKQTGWISDDESTRLWSIWDNSGKTVSCDTEEGLEIMLLAAEEMNIPLTAVWNTIRKWESEKLTPASRRMA